MKHDPRCPVITATEGVCACWAFEVEREACAIIASNESIRLCSEQRYKEAEIALEIATAIRQRNKL